MDLPLPEIDDGNRPYWEGLAGGVLRFQRCRACGHAWLPARDACPNCLAAEAVWEDAAGEGRVVSWVVYHKAYHEAFQDRLPYTVAIIALAEGPRLIAGLDAPDQALRLDMPVRLRPRKAFGMTLPAFVPAEAAS
ncbi:MAG TPA: OB-fold domain-containing protein [Roseomonas sp.]|nr:OB-fold domain-containing protein [Roseomonas sp.]